MVSEEKSTVIFSLVLLNPPISHWRQFSFVTLFFDTQNCPFIFIFRVSIFLVISLIYSFTSSTFPIRVLSMLITTILNSLSDNPSISIITESGSDDGFVSSDHVFPFSVACSCLFVLFCCCWTPDTMSQVIETEVNRPLFWGFMLIWLGVCPALFNVLPN